MMDYVRHTQVCSVRHCSKVLGIRRQTYYKRKGGIRSEERDDELKSALKRVTRQFVVWGFWMVFHFLRNEGHIWNHKRVYRVWKSLSLDLRQAPKREKIRRSYQELLSPDWINEGWAMDFVSDWVVGPELERVRIINIVDECSRKVLWTEAHKSISASTLTEILDKVVAWRGQPGYIRCDNGPEFISNKLKKWAGDRIEIKYIQPGKPSQNGIIERLNKTLRIECIDQQWFTSMAELNEALQEWSVAYNTLRPHQSIRYKTPDNFEICNKKIYFYPVAA
jgi:putative transposase